MNLLTSFLLFVMVGFLVGLGVDIEKSTYNKLRRGLKSRKKVNNAD